MLVHAYRQPSVCPHYGAILLSAGPLKRHLSPGEHAPATAKKINAAKAALREATRLYNVAIGAIEGKPAKSVKSGVVVVFSKRSRFMRTEKESVTQRLRCLSPTENEFMTEIADVVKETFDLAPGVPTIVPDWVTKDKFFASLQKDGALSAL
jgi:hypothetical protein